MFVPRVQWGVAIGVAVVAWTLRSRAAEGTSDARRIGETATVAAVIVSSNVGIADPPSYHITRLTTEQGLPQNSVRALLQTRDGYLWVGTLAGLARFDGVRFKIFNVSNTPEMLNDAIDSLAEDRVDGSLWINAGQRLLRYHEHRFERFDEERGFPKAFGDVWPARDGGLWYSPNPGQLVRLQDHTHRNWQLCPRTGADGNDIVENRIIQVEEEHAGHLLVLMYSGLYRFEPGTGDVTRLGPPRGSMNRYFFRQTDGTILLAAREGLWRRNVAEWDLIEAVPPGDRQCPAGIYPGSNGDLWIPWGIDVPWYPEWLPPRLARFRAGQSEFLDLSSLQDYPITRFLKDREGHLWIGTASGLCQLRPKAVRVYAREHGLRNDQVKAIAAGPDGTVWAGTEQGVCGIKDGQVTNLPPVAPDNWGRPEGLLADRQGRVWYAAKADSVVAFEGGEWVSPADLNLGSSWVRTLYEDRSGRIWGGFDRGVAWLDEAGAVHRLTNGWSHSDVRVIYQDRRGDMWFGTYGGGLHRLHDGQITAYTTRLGELNNRAWWIHEDADGVFWVATRNGLNRFVPPGVAAPDRNLALNRPSGPAREREVMAEGHGTFFTFTTRHGLRENIINNLQEDDFGYLWLSGPQGIYRVARQELNDVAAGRQARVQVLAFGETDGMFNSQCTGGTIQPSGCKDRAGRIWFPTVRGVVMIDPRTIRRNDVPPPVVIEQVRVDEEVVHGDRVPGSRPKSEANPKLEVRNRQSLKSDTTVRLAPGRARVLEIRYTGNSFAAPQRMRFRYQLDGHDRDWRDDEDNRRTAIYTGLHPGRYTFRVTACNNHGIWNEQPAEFSFTLAPQFWQTWWFYVLAAMGLLALGGAIQAYRLRWQRRLLQTEQRQALADERSRIARDLHDDLGAALTGLALQVDVLRRAAHASPALKERLADTAGRIRALARHMREVVWTVNPSCDTVSSFASFLEQQAGQFDKAVDLRCRLEFPEDIPELPLDGQTRHELALAVREAITNVVRHAAASEIVLGLEIAADQLRVRIADNGRGFLVNDAEPSGHGLANMCARLQRVAGRCEYRSAPGAGTTIELCVPLNRSSHAGRPTTP
ncbi:MAG: ATP-binding protein [Verrucomicrobia bacterium]|nr:ATP-binding protein [Verrucomicrobiota bacterium]